MKSTAFDPIALWYNKTLFDEAGLDYPTADWTWDDVTEAVFSSVVIRFPPVICFLVSNHSGEIHGLFIGNTSGYLEFHMYFRYNRNWWE